MLSTLNTFICYYYSPDSQFEYSASFPPDRGVKDVSTQKWEVINIEEAAESYSVPSDIKKKLDTIITNEVYNELISENNIDKLKASNFVFLKATKSVRVVYHQDYPEWLIKVGRRETRYLSFATECLKLVSQEDKIISKNIHSVRDINLLRAPGRAFFAEKLEETDESIKKYFHFSKEYLYTCPYAKEKDLRKKYFSISERQEIYTGQETLQIIQSQKQETQQIIVRKIVKFIEATRFHDWHTNNLTLNKTRNYWRFEMIDSEPIGALIHEKDPDNNLMDSKKQVLLGLILFRDQYCRQNGLIAMVEEVDRQILDYLKRNSDINGTPCLVNQPLTVDQKIEMITLIFISIICPLIPLFLLIRAFFQTNSCLSAVFDKLKISRWIPFYN